MHHIHRRPRLLLAIALLLVIAGCTGAADTASDAASDAGDGDNAADVAEAEGEPVRIGVLTALSGPFAQWGVMARDGMRLAADEINADGGIDGRQIELVERDTQSVPEEGVTALRGMIERDEIVAAGGVISSDVGLATARIAEASEVPLFLVKAGAGAVLAPDSRYTFRTCLPAAAMTMEPVAEYLAQEGLTRAGGIVADYEWGRSIEEAIGTALEGTDVESQIEVAPVSDDDFTSYLRALQPFEPDVIVATGHPPGAGAIVSQSAELGIDTLVTGPWSNYASIMDAVGDAAYDRFVDFDCADYSSADYQELAGRFYERFGAFMEDDAVAGYGIVTMLAETVGEVGDDRIAISEYLHESTFELPGYTSPVEWTAWGELASSTPAVSVVRRQEPPDGVNPGAEWYPEVLLISDPLGPYEPE